MKVTLRKKPRKNGTISRYYLDIYIGKRVVNGKTLYDRKIELLNVYHIEKPKSLEERTANKNNQRLAEKIAIQRQNEINEKKYGFEIGIGKRKNFVDFFREMTEKRIESSGSYGNWDSALKHLTDFTGEHFYLDEVNQNFLEGFKEHLRNYRNERTGKPLAQNTKVSYFNKVRAAINSAYQQGVLKNNPVGLVKAFKEEATEREFLTEDELQKLTQVPVANELLRRVFLFSCLSGLRFSDLQKLTWSEVHSTDDGYRIVFKQKKTNELQYQDINLEAYSLLGNRQEEAERVFKGLKYSAYLNQELKNWISAAGIDKKITFHCARHTYATLLLTAGVDLYVIMELLGHKEIKTTQIYAKIIGARRKDAVTKLPTLNLK